MASFEKINYNLRPNKSIERKMICESIARLSIIEDLKQYRYIGLGSTYFSDFVLFHKSLGFTKMISIEGNEDAKERVEFNIPFSCIEMEYGESTTILPNLELDKHKNIIWLDYDGTINRDTFSDLHTIVTNTKECSIFLISLNAESGSLGETVDKKKEKLIELIGSDRIPGEYSDLSITKKNYIKMLHRMIDMQIQNSISIRNGASENKSAYRQIFNFIYKDGATMLTIGGIIANEDLIDGYIDKMQLRTMDFYMSSESYYEIKCPNLTFKEVNALNRCMPCLIECDSDDKITNKEFKSIPLSKDDIINYKEVYRYYPNYAETNL